MYRLGTYSSTRILADFKNRGEAEVFNQGDPSEWSQSYLENGISVASSFGQLKHDCIYCIVQLVRFDCGF